MNVGSGPQVQQLLFAGATKDASSKGRGKAAKEAAAELAVPLERVFKVGWVCMVGVGILRGRCNCAPVMPWGSLSG